MSIRLNRTTGQSAANTAQTVSSLVGSAGATLRIRHIDVKYSAAPTHAGITITLNSGAGAAYDTQLAASAANAQNYSFTQDNLLLKDDDVIDVLAPAGGATITSQISIYYDVVE